MNIPGSRIRDLREAAGWSPNDLARACSMRERYLLDIEEGVVLKINPLTYQKIADALGVTLAMLDGSEAIIEAKTIDEVVPNRYKWLVSVTVKLIILLGVISLTTGLITLGNLLLLWILSQI